MTFAFLVHAMGCQNDAAFRRPIEITGYLDPTRVELTSRTQVGVDEVTISVVGRPGATTSAEPLSIRNERSDEEVEVDPTADGGFWATIDALAGDEIAIGQQGAETIAVAVEPFETLPEREASAHLSDDQERAIVSVHFAAGLDEGWVVSVANPPLSLISNLERTGEAEFEGQIAVSDPADTVLELYALTPDEQSTLSAPIEVPVE
jgi:hypothetical protein